MRAASWDPQEMQKGGGGLADNFDATVTEARVIPWNYDKPDRPWSLFVRLKLELEGDHGFSDEQVEALEQKGQYYSVAKLKDWVPSDDGDTELEFDEDDPESAAGYYAVPTEEFEKDWEKRYGDWRKKGSKVAPPQLFGGTNWAFFLQRLVDAGMPQDMVRNPDVRFIEGGKYHFCRVPPPPRPGMATSATGDEGERKRDGKILVVTDVLEMPGAAKSAKKGATKGASAGAGGSAKATAKAAATNGNSALHDAVETAIIEALGESPEGIKRTTCFKIASQAAEKPADKKAAMDIVKDNDFFNNSEVLLLDEDTGMVTLA
jgi:hypothetical protein